MKKLQCVIADDEVYALDILENYIGKVEQLTLAARCKDAFEVYNALNRHTVDLLFLDIQMPQLSGLDFLKSLSNPPKVVFTTAYQHYAVSAFELNAMDYLLKPFSFERFLKAVDRLLNDNDPVSVSSNSGFMVITSERQKVMLELKNVVFIQALGNYLKIHTTDKVFITHMSIRAILEQLPATEFRQVHKSFVIPLSKIESFSATVAIVHGKEIPIGRAFRENLLP